MINTYVVGLCLVWLFWKYCHNSCLTNIWLYRELT